MTISFDKTGLYYAVLIACAVVVACSSDKGTTPGAAAFGGTGGAAVGGAQPLPGGAGGVPAAVGGAGAGGAPVVITAGVAAPPIGGAPAPIAGAAGGAPGTLPPTSEGGASSVLQYHANAKRDANYKDAAFTRTAAAGLKMDPSFTAMVTGEVYAQPLYFEGGPGGADLVIAATEQNEVTAFNAMSGMMVWRKMLAAPVTGGLPCGRIMPLGVTGTPVIDAKTRTLYVAAMTTGPKHQIYALSIDDGAILPGWPVDVNTVSAGGRQFESSVHNQRGALLLVDDMLYVPYGGHFGDCGDYHGWVVGVPTANPSAPVAFATEAHAGGIWAPGGLASDGTSIYAATGNTMSEAGGILSSPATWGHGNAILKLGKQLATVTESQTTDFFAAQDWAAKDGSDLDVGGSGPVLFTVPGATPSNLAIGLGKSGEAFLVDAANLGGMGGEIETKMVAGGGISGGMIQAAAAYTTATGTFVAFRAAQTVQGCGSGSGYLGGLKISAASPPSMSVAWCAGAMGLGSPIVTTTDGMAESVVWYITRSTVVGFNGENGMPVFDGGAVSLGTVANFQTPIVAKGRMFVASQGQIHALTVSP